MNLQNNTESQLSYYNIDLSTITEIRIQKNHEHITFNPAYGTLLFKHVCSPAESPYYNFPPVKPAINLQLSDIEKILLSFTDIFNKIPFRKNYRSPCDPGFSYTNYLIISDINKNIYEYSDIYLKFNSEYTNEVFFILFNWMKKQYDYYEPLYRHCQINEDPREFNISRFNKLNGDINAKRLPIITSQQIAENYPININDNIEYTAEQKEQINSKIPQTVRQWVEDTLNMYLKDIIPMLGNCYDFWSATADLYMYQGYKWYSPHSIHPEIHFD